MSGSMRSGRVGRGRRPALGGVGQRSAPERGSSLAASGAGNSSGVVGLLRDSPKGVK